MILGTILRRSDPEPLEIAGGLMSLVWGVTLALWGSWGASTIDGGVSPFHALSAYVWGAEWRQGLTMAAVGAVKLLFVELQATPRNRGLVSALAFTLWGIVFSSAVHSTIMRGTVSTGLPVYAMFTASTAWVVYRHAIEAGIRHRYEQ